MRRLVAAWLSCCTLALVFTSPLRVMSHARVAGATAVTTFPHFGLTIRHPTAWRIYEYPEFGFAFTILVAYLSPARFHDPCVKSSRTFSCASWPLRVLPPQNVIVRWTAEGFHGGASMATLRGRVLVIHGRPARLWIVTGPGPFCLPGTDRAITLDLLRFKGNYFAMQACLRGPNIGRMERSVLAMGYSAQIQLSPSSSPQPRAP